MYRRTAVLAVVFAALTGCRNEPAPSRPVSSTTRALPATREARHLPLDDIEPSIALPIAATQPGAPPPLEALELFARARVALLDNQRFTAINYLEEAIRLDPDSFELRNALARAYARTAPHGDQTVSSLEAAARINPDCLEVQLELGRAHLARNEPDRALYRLRLAILTSEYARSVDLSLLADFYLARALQRTGYERAAYDRYLILLARRERRVVESRMNPEVAALLGRPESIHLDAARLAERLGLFEEALAHYQTIVRTNNENFEVQSHIAQCLVQLNQADEAIEQVGAVVSRFDANPDSMRLLRDVFARLNRAQDLPAELQRLRRERPGDRAILFALCDELQARGDALAAQQALRDSLTVDNPSMEVLRRLVAMLQSSDSNLGAAQLLIEISARHPDLTIQTNSLWESLLNDNPALKLRDLQTLSVPAEDAAAQLYWISRVAGQKGRNKLARESMRLSAATSPLFAPALRAQVAAIGSDGSRDQASRDVEIDKLIARARDSGPGQLAGELEGLRAVSRSDHQGAIALLEQASAATTQPSPELTIALAVECKSAGDVARFEHLMWKLISDLPDFEDPYATLFRHHLESSNGAAARKVLDTWLASQPASVNARLLNATVLYRFGNQNDAAEAILLSVFQERPDDRQVLSSLRAFYNSTRKPEVWIEKLDAEIKRDPRNRVAVEQLVESYVSAGVTAKAVELLNAQAGVVAGDADGLYWLANQYQQAHQSATARQSLERALQADPTHASAANDLGYQFADEGIHLERAEKLIRLAVEAEPDNESFLDSLGWVLYKTGRFAEARKWLEQAVDVRDVAEPVMLDHLGDTMYRLNEPVEATRAWQLVRKRIRELNSAGVERRDLADLLLSVDRKLSQIEKGQPVTVAAVATQAPASNP